MTSKPSATNCPNAFPHHAPSCIHWPFERRFFLAHSACLSVSAIRAARALWGAAVTRLKSGGYCGRVPPLPIPNREVKPACADGTAMQCGRVGRRLLFITGPRVKRLTWGLFFVALILTLVLLSNVFFARFWGYTKNVVILHLILQYSSK